MTPTQTNEGSRHDRRPDPRRRAHHRPRGVPPERRGHRHRRPVGEPPFPASDPPAESGPDRRVKARRLGPAASASGRRSAGRPTRRAACRTEEPTSLLSDPSSAAASPALLSISSAIRASMPGRALEAVTVGLADEAAASSIAWVCSASGTSARTNVEATYMSSPTPAAVRNSATAAVGVLHERVDVRCRTDGVWLLRTSSDAQPVEGLRVHDVDVLGEEDDLAGAARELAA